MKEYEEQLFQALIRSGKGKAVKRGAKKHEDDLAEAPVARSRGDVNRASSKEVKMVAKDLRRVRASDSADGWFCLPEHLGPDHRNRWDIIEKALN